MFDDATGLTIGLANGLLASVLIAGLSAASAGQGAVGFVGSVGTDFGLTVVEVMWLRHDLLLVVNERIDGSGGAWAISWSA